MSDSNDLMEVVKQTAFNLSAVSEQMGIIASEIKSLKVSVMEQEAKVSDVANDLAQYKESQRQKEWIEPSDAQEYEDAISDRVAELLKPVDRFDLFGKFKMKCWCDAKKHSYMRGHSGIYTKKMFHQDVIDYIRSWQPYSYGVYGYIEHLDELASKR